jgi:hypothetical protein
MAGWCHKDYKRVPKQNMRMRCTEVSKKFELVLG